MGPEVCGFGLEASKSLKVVGLACLRSMSRICRFQVVPLVGARWHVRMQKLESCTRTLFPISIWTLALELGVVDLSTA